MNLCFVYYVWFDNLKVGYDNNSDGDIDDEGDDLLTSNGFGSTALSLTHDNNGNLTDDGMYKYTYDPWNRLVKVTAKEDTDITIQQAAYDALGRRIKKVVTNSGDHDGTVVYYYKGHQIIETRDGSSNLMSQVYHGTQYIDEIVSIRLEHGRAYVHQDANWNVTTLTDLSGQVLERYYYSPYGQLEVTAETYFGDYDGDGDIDSDDADDLCTTGCTCEFTSTATGDCRVFDFDCDGDLDETDQDTLRSLYQGLSEDMQNHRIPSTTFSQAGNPFTHQGLVLDVEIGSYQNRLRQYNAKLKRFMQRDPLVDEHRQQPIRCGPRKRQYRDGLSLYQYLRCTPLGGVDPFGMAMSQSRCQSLVDAVWETDPFVQQMKGDIRSSPCPIGNAKPTCSARCLRGAQGTSLCAMINGNPYLDVCIDYCQMDDLRSIRETVRHETFHVWNCCLRDPIGSPSNCTAAAAYEESLAYWLSEECAIGGGRRMNHPDCRDCIVSGCKASLGCGDSAEGRAEAQRLCDAAFTHAFGSNQNPCD